MCHPTLKNCASGWFSWHISTWQCATRCQLRVPPSTAIRRIPQTEGAHGSCSHQRPELSTPFVDISSSCCLYIAEPPLGNRLLQGWFQIGRFWEGFLQPSSCSCAQDLDSAGISMFYHMFMRLFGSFSLLKWVALWKLHHNDNCPVLPEITFAKLSPNPQSEVFAPAKHAVVQPCSLPCKLEPSWASPAATSKFYLKQPKHIHLRRRIGADIGGSQDRAMTKWSTNVSGEVDYWRIDIPK